MLGRLLVCLIALITVLPGMADSLPGQSDPLSPLQTTNDRPVPGKNFYTVDDIYGHFPLKTNATEASDGISLTKAERQFLKRHPIIKVAIDPDWYPMDFVDEEGVHRGISADYLARLSEIIGIQFEPDTDVDWTTSLVKVENRELDMFAMAAATPDRTQYARFTRPYIHSPMVIVTRDDEGYIEGANGLVDMLVGVTEGYASHEWLASNHPEINLQTFETTVNGLNAVATGETDAFVDNLASVSFLIKQQGLSNLKVSGQMPKSFDLAMGVRSDWPQLVGILQKGLDAMTEAEKSEIYDRWIQLEFESNLNFSEVAPYFVLLLFILLGVTVEMLRVHALQRKLRAANAQLLEVEELLIKKNQDLEKLSVTDKLTGVCNRLKLDASLDEQYNRSRRYGRPVSLILMDLDIFKSVNDAHGHQVGDQVLKRFAELVGFELRSSDIFGRWGGEEFMIICPETELKEAMVIAQKIQARIREENFTNDIKQTVSLGIAELSPEQTVTDWVSACDVKLYEAKSKGRDRIVI